MFKFTIRELLLLTVIATLALGWWMDHRRLKRLGYIHESHGRYFRELLERDGYTVTISPDGMGVGARKGP